MSTLTVKVCEECGRRSAKADGWLVVSNMDVRSAKTGESVLSSEQGMDICSPGCLLRYVSRSLDLEASNREPWISRTSQHDPA